MARDTADPTSFLYDRSLTIAQKRDAIEAMQPSPQRMRALQSLQRLEDIEELQRRKMELKREKPDLRVIAQRRGSAIYVIGAGGGRGEVVDAERGVSYPDVEVATILNQSWWGPPDPGLEPYDILARVQWDAHHRARTHTEIEREKSPLERAKRRLAYLQQRFGKARELGEQ